MQHFKVLRLFFVALVLHTQFSNVLTLGNKYLIVAKDNYEQSSVNFAQNGRNQLWRNKRDVIDNSVKGTFSKPITNVTELKAEHTQLLIDWVGKGSHVVVSLTRENKHRPQTHSSVFISYNYGASFQNKSDLFVLANGSAAVIATFYKNPKFTSRFIFTDTLHRYLFVTLDYGRTVWPHKLDFTPSDVITHPTDASTILVHDTENPSRKLWASVDFGETWHVLEYRVQGYHWSGEGTAPVLYVQREDPRLTSAVLAYSDFSPETSSSVMPKRVISDVEQFEVKEEFLFAVKKVRLLGSKTREPHLQLWISNNGGPFLRAVFSHNLPHQQYYVPHVSQGQVMVCVAHDSVTSHLYVSSVPQSPQHEVRFSLSLPRIFYYQPNATWHNSWIDDVEEKAFADLHPVAGVRGVLIASQVSANYTRRPHGTVGPQHLTTLITFDLGGQWQPVQPPKTDALGNPIKCKEASGCSLHLSQQFARLYPNTQSETILSVPSAPGIVLATGTIGGSLKGKTSVYLSNDAGLSWYQVLQGNYLYVMCDHGGLMLAVENFRSEGETDSLLYSTDEGETWRSYKFSDKAMRIYGLKTEHGENSTVVLLFGSREGHHEWVVFKVDLKPVFYGKCTKKDYKTWSPTDSLTSMSRCLLGRSEVFERRAPHANCYNGFNYDRPVSVENCPCARQDYECDYGYVASKDTHQELKDSLGKPVDVLAKDGAKALINKDAAWLHPALKEQTCILDTSDTMSQSMATAMNPFPASLQPLCKEGSFYNRSRGYRKIPGDSCHGGQDYLYEPQLTPCPLFEEQEFLLVSSRQSVLRYDLLKPETGLQPLPLTGLSMVIAFDFDMASNCLYWADVLLNKIMRSCFDGAHGQEVIVESGTQRVEGLALDWVSQNLYLVDAASKSISAIKLPPRPAKESVTWATAPKVPVLWRTLLDKTALHRPRGIALHPVQGLMFYTDWSDTNPMVARSNLDGTKQQVLFGKGIVGWPNGITVDFEDDRIYFVDARLDFVASADFNGQNLHKLTTTAERPFAVAVHKSLVYWDDTSARKVLRADKNHGWGVTPINNSSIKGLVDLNIYGTWSQKGSNACGDNSSLCPYLCVGLPNGEHACLCPDGMKEEKTDGNSTCVCNNGTAPPTPGGICPPPTPSCGNYRFGCTNGRCVPAQWRCDGTDDCGDNSDEAGCKAADCHSAGWQCGNGRCILSTWRCDYEEDCHDGSDEKDCDYPACTDEQFRCDNHRCITHLLQCDRQDDCKDGSDERDCRYTARPNCSRTEFRCAGDGACLPETWRCDGEHDCADGSDETNCDSNQCHEDRLFQCSNRQCIERSFACDGEPDCEDGSDEVNCTLTTTTTSATPTVVPGSLADNCNSSLMFRCQVGHCVPLWWRCDGLDNCGDNSDEANCRLPWANTTTTPPTTTRGKGCALDQFECNEGGKDTLGPVCLWESAVCDGERDCPGGEDEFNCSKQGPCAPHPSSPNATTAGGGMTKASFYRCLRSEGCFLITTHCDGHRDCADGSDEEGCTATPEPVALSCPSGQFLCDGGDCHPNSRLCDKSLDCLDHKDEDSCPHQLNHHLLLNLALVTNTSVSVKWRVEGATQRPSANASSAAATNSADLEFLPAIIVQAALGNPAAWQNASSWTQNTSYTFTRLVPATAYLVRVFIRQLMQDGQLVSATELALNTISVNTYQGVPSPPLSVVAEQSGQQVRVKWQRPAQPNGILQTYTVWLSPPSPAQQVVVGGQMTDMTVSLAAQLHHGQNISVWVTANTIDFRSAPSEVATLSYVVLPSPANVRRVQVDETSAVLAWDAVKGAVAYSISHTRPENEFLTGRVTLKTTDTSAKLLGLSPGLVYVVGVRAVACSGGDTSSPSAGQCSTEAADVEGPLSVLSVSTTGRPLEPVTHLSAELNKDAPTTVKLSWRAPLYTGNVDWQYSVLWGNSGSDFRRGMSTNNSVLTPNTWFEVHGLDACVAYLLAVMVAQPYGHGPAVQVQVMTGEDSLAPPQHVTASVENLNLTVRWQRPCTLARMGQDEHGTSNRLRPTADGAVPPAFFLLLVTETTRNKTSRVAVPGTPYMPPNGEAGWLQHDLQVEYGGQYEVQVQSAAEGARLSEPPIKAVAPLLPPPRQLTFTPTDSSFHWRNGPGMPQQALLTNYSYVLFLRDGADCTDGGKEDTRPWEPHPVHRPPHPCPDLIPGRLYCAAVAFKTQRGYLSPKSQIIRVELPLGAALVLTQQSVVGATVAVVLVVLALVVVVAVLALRHRRLPRSFLNFANSRYSHAQGTTSLSANDHNLEDEDSPVIQGFSDDEPLVIA